MFSIGDPGRAAAELADGAVPQRPGPADVELSGASALGMIVRAASRRGLVHQASGQPRQDAFAICRDEARPGRIIAVVCDGAGSYTRSHEAAALASRVLAERAGAGQSLAESFVLANRELRELAGLAGHGQAGDDAKPDGMATTAVAVAVAPEEGGWTGEVAWVGDSMLWHLGGDSRWRLLTQDPAQGDATPYHSTETTILPSVDGACASREFRLADGALFVMSDGVGDPLHWGHDVQERLAEWWSRPPDLLTFAAQVGFARKSHADDRTVIGIWPV